jgi:hypothetical protein
MESAICSLADGRKAWRALSKRQEQASKVADGLREEASGAKMDPMRAWARAMEVAVFHFDMSIAQNFAVFVDPERGLRAVVESFDNEEFLARLGPLDEDFDGCREIGAAVASNDGELNEKLDELVKEALSGG